METTYHPSQTSANGAPDAFVEKDNAFFDHSLVSRAECNAKAYQLCGGTVQAVAKQGCNSYTVYAGETLQRVVQFRLASKSLEVDTIQLAVEIYGSLAPNPKLVATLEEGDNKDGSPVNIYLMDRLPGIDYMTYIVSQETEDNSPECKAARETLMMDLAHVHALSWKSAQSGTDHVAEMRDRYLSELRMLLGSLSQEFEPSIKMCIDVIDDILSLPMVLLHDDFSVFNFLVDEKTCHLKAILDWEKAQIAPFGMNLEQHQIVTGAFILHKGWKRHEDYAHLWSLFWQKFQEEAGTLDEKQRKSIRMARVLGLLLTRGFELNRSDQKRVPIKNDNPQGYAMETLNALLVREETRFDDLS